MKISILKTLLLISLMLLLSECLIAQKDYPFSNDRCIKIDNPIFGAKKFTIYIKAESTSNSQADGWGTYARLLGSSGFFLELADHKGMLGYYNGRKWGSDVGIDIRKERKDIFLTFDNGEVIIMEGEKVITKRTHAVRDFRSSHLFLGSTFLASERFVGYIDHFAIYDRVLSEKEIANILKNDSRKINETNPVEYYDFTKGTFYVTKPNSKNYKIPPNVGLPKSRSSRSMDRVGIARVETTTDELPVEANSPLNLEMEFSKIDLNNLEYEGTILKNKELLQPGAYDLIVGKNGKIEIKIKVVEDR